MSDRTDLPSPLTHDAWASALRGGDLLGQRCADCGHETAAPKAACVRCGSRDVETVSLPTTGTVHSATAIAVAPEGYDGPYRIAIVDLGAARVLGRLEGEAAIGDRVELAGAIADAGEDEPAPVFS